MEEPDRLEQAIRELRDANRVLGEEVRAFRQAAEDAERLRERGQRRRALTLVLALYGVPVLGCAGLGLFRLAVPREPNEAERWYQQERERHGRTERALGRAEKLLDRLEKVAPPK